MGSEMCIRDRAEGAFFLPRDFVEQFDWFNRYICQSTNRLAIDGSAIFQALSDIQTQIEGVDTQYFFLNGCPLSVGVGDQSPGRLFRAMGGSRSLRGGHQRLIQLPVTSQQLIPAEQAGGTMARETPHQSLGLCEIPALHHMQTNGEGERLTEGAEAWLAEMAPAERKHICLLYTSDAADE